VSEESIERSKSEDEDELLLRLSLIFDDCSKGKGAKQHDVLFYKASEIFKVSSHIISGTK
jgi:hypothetical protein